MWGNLGQIVRRAPTVEEEAFKAPCDGIKSLVRSEDFIEGPLAFSEKRDPVWKGR